jgi:hypothetical protein
MSKSHAPHLLNDDGTASMATAIMSSHHGLRRDLAQFAIALDRIIAGDISRAAAVQEEWARYRATLHGHHQAEDNGLFPSMRAEHPELGGVIDGLDADHRRIDPLLEAGDRVFASLPSSVAGAVGVVGELRALLDAHLATEEAHVVPFLRGAKTFPAPDSDAALAMYADGFAWATFGVAPEILEQINCMLPAALVERLPAARAAFAERCVRVWGTAETGASRTSVPDWIG